MIACYVTTTPGTPTFLGRPSPRLKIFAPCPLEHGGWRGTSWIRLSMAAIRGDWKPMPSVGPGVRGIRIRVAAGAFLVINVAKFASTIYVLHCFQKKTLAPRKSDLLSIDAFVNRASAADPQI